MFLQLVYIVLITATIFEKKIKQKIQTILDHDAIE